MSSRSFPPGVQFAGSAAALSTLAEPSAEGGSSRVRYVYVPISSHPTHTNKLVREGQTVSVSTELEIKGGFGERGASSANEADLGAGVLDEVYREFEDRVVAVKPIPATLGGRVAVLLRSGVLLVCDPTLRRTLTRSQPPASLPALAGDRVVRLDAFEHSDTPSWRTALQYKDGGVILAQHIAPRRASPSRSFANAAAPGLKKRKAAFSDTSSAQESAHAYTGFVIAYPTGQSEGGQQPTAVEIPGPVVDMTVTSRAEVLVLRPKGAVEVIDILSDNSASVEALQRTRAALAPLSVGIQLHPANSALLAIPAPSPSSLALLVIPAPASKTPASTTPTLVTLLLDLRFGRVLAAAETILPTSLFSGSNMAIPFAVRPALAASSQNLILSVVGPARQMIQVQELIVPDRGSSAASALRGSQSDALASRWLSVSRSPALRSHAKALGTDVAEEIASIRAESGEAEPAGQWTASKIQRVDSLWGEWIAGQAMIQTEEKTRPRRRPTHVRRAMWTLASLKTLICRLQSFTPDVARTLARSCLDLPGVPPRFGPGPSVALRYPSQIVAQLIRDDVLSDAYVERGVLATLVALQDWVRVQLVTVHDDLDSILCQDNVVLGVSRIPDLSEDTLASALQAALSSPSAPADKVLLSILNRSSAVVTWRSIVSALLVGEVVRALEIVQSWLRDILSLDGIRESPKSTRSRPAHLALDNNVNQHEPLAKALDLPAASGIH